LNSSLTARSWDAFGSGFKSGAIGGGIAGFMTSEATMNFLRGDGFVNNETLFNRWNDGSIEGYKRIAERFGDGEFVSYNDRTFQGWQENPGAAAVTNRETGRIFYNENAFLDFSKFQEVSMKEKWISMNVKNGRLPSNPNLIELQSWKYLYKNQGLLKNPSPQHFHYMSNHYIYNPIPNTHPIGIQYIWEIKKCKNKDCKNITICFHCSII